MLQDHYCSRKKQQDCELVDHSYKPPTSYYLVFGYNMVGCFAGSACRSSGSLRVFAFSPLARGCGSNFVFIIINSED